jgi:glycosyltransferase involved in cell wall biosynthesis
MKTRPIKVMRIITRLNIGGPTIHVSLLTQRLAAPDYESVLVVGSLGKTEGDMTYYATERGITPIFVPELSNSMNPVRDLRALWKLWRLMRKHKPDVVHTHTMKAGFVGRFAAKLAGIPVIVHTAHGYGLNNYFSPLKSAVFHTLDKAAARVSSRVFTLTESLRREMIEVYHVAAPDRITVVPLGLDLAPFAQTPRHQGDFRKAWNLPPDAPLIAVVGRLVPIKNHSLFLHMAEKVRAVLPDARFLIIGDGELRESIEAEVRARGVQDVVIFTGWIQALAPVYSDLSATVITSLSEGTPVSLIEAMAGGCPVVSTAVGGVPELLQGGELGKLVPSGDADALAQAVIETVQNPPPVETIRTAIVERYGIDRLARDLDRLYREMLR